MLIKKKFYQRKLFEEKKMLIKKIVGFWCCQKQVWSTHQVDDLKWRRHKRQPKKGTQPKKGRKPKKWRQPQKWKQPKKWWRPQK